MKSIHFTGILILLISLRESSGNESAFCEMCNCTTVEERINVNCENNNAETLKNAMWDVNYYMDEDAQEYPINVLNFSYNHISKLEKVFPIASVKIFDLSSTGLYEIVDSCFSEFQEMQELILSNNLLEHIYEGTFKGIQIDGMDYPLKSLETLRLDGNKIQSFKSDAFQHIDRNLKNLYLGNNPFKVFDVGTMQAVTTVTYLKVLDLSNTQIKQLGQYFLHTPKYLNELNLADNFITSIDELDLDEAHTLQILNLNGNPIREINGENGFPAGTPIKILHMCRMPELEIIGAHSLGKLDKLDELYMHDNPKLTKIDETALTDVQSGIAITQPLKKLYINDNKLSHLALNLNWDHLEYFDIRGNPWTCECENQWIVSALIPVYATIDLDACKELKCSAPYEMEGKSMYNMSIESYEMRCLDMYGNHPDKDGIILVCVLLGTLLGVVLVLFVMYAYKRHWFGLCDSSPAAYSRQFYSTTSNTIDDPY